MTGHAALLSHPVDIEPLSEDESSNQLPEPPALGLDLHLQFNLAGFTVSIPLLGDTCRQQPHRSGRGRGSSSTRQAVAHDAAAVPVRPGASSAASFQRGEPQGIAAAAAALPAEVLQLQQLLVARDPGMLARLAATGEPADAHFFTRWLIARRWCVERAARDIAAHVGWRVEFMGTGGGGGCSDVLEGLQQGGERRVFLQGCDRWGQPVVLVKAGRHVLSSADLPVTKRLICCALDLATSSADPALNPLGRVCCIFDLSGLRARDLDAKALGAIFELLQAHYPERLARLFFVNAPFIFWGVWRLVSPFLHVATREKIRFVSGRGVLEALLAAVPPSVLPGAYGGTAELVPLEEAVAARRSAAAAAAAVGVAMAAKGQAQGQGQGLAAGAAGQGPHGGRWGWRAKLARVRRGLGAGARGAGRAMAARVGRPAGRAAAAAGRLLRAAAAAHGAGGGERGSSSAGAGSAMALGAMAVCEPKSLDKLLRAAFVAGFCAVAAATMAGVHSVAL